MQYVASRKVVRSSVLQRYDVLYLSAISLAFYQPRALFDAVPTSTVI